MKSFIKSSFFLALLLSLGASGYPQQNSPSASLVVLNARIKTFDERLPDAEAIAVSNGKIIAVGSNKNIRKLIDGRTRIIDAFGRRIIPGFNDAHVHLLSIGNQFSSIDLSKSIGAQESLAKIAEYARFLPPGRWILGGNWDEKSWAPMQYATKTELDKVSPANPVFIYKNDGSIALANSLALEQAKILSGKTNMLDGEILRGEDTNPNGILKGGAILRLRLAAPKQHSSNTYEVLQTASNLASSLGVTSVQDLSSDDNFDVLNQLYADGKLKTRVYECTALDDWRDRARSETKRASGSPFVRTGCLKGISEGNETTEELFLQTSNADRAGLQVIVHAIGGEAVTAALEVFRRVENDIGAKDRRLRIEHANGLNESDIEKFRELNVIASMQPHLFDGNEPYKKLFAGGAKMAFGSDAAMVSFNPLLGIYDAVREDRADRLTVEEAVRLYTLGSAFAEFQEKEKGSISVGKFADLIMLSDDIFGGSPEIIPKAYVVLTIVNGEIVYRKN